MFGDAHIAIDVSPCRAIDVKLICGGIKGGTSALVAPASPNRLLSEMVQLSSAASSDALPPAAAVFTVTTRSSAKRRR
jgi:hypothetical protein